jgi:hypothetical protein
MAFTSTQITNTVFGNMRVIFLSIVADSAEGTVQVPGIAKIIGVGITHQSGTISAACMVFNINAGTTGTVAAGQLALSSVGSGTFAAIVYGTA